MWLQLQIVLALEDMFLKHVLYHQQKKISQDGLYQKQEELQWRNQKQIEIKLMIHDLPSVANATPKIEQDLKLILDQVQDHNKIN